MGPSAQSRKKTRRIQQVELAKILAGKGHYQQALELLKDAHGRYCEDRRQTMVAWLIQDCERRLQESS